MKEPVINPLNHASPLSATLDLTERLTASLQDLAACPREACKSLRHLLILLESLPLTQAEYCYFRNRVESTADLLTAGEADAARYQFRELSLKLNRLVREMA